MLRDDTVKVTLALSRRSVEVFKHEAANQRGPYQRMIRALVDGLHAADVVRLHATRLKVKKGRVYLRAYNPFYSLSNFFIICSIVALTRLRNSASPKMLFL